ncbi:MAG: PAS domain S-box protein [Chloroflexi bacterium]|nr:PAS domain S-box protein [Chloroflexota bacterium]
MLISLYYETRISGVPLSFQGLGHVLENNPALWFLWLIPAFTTAAPLVATGKLRQIIARSEFFEALFNNTPVAIVTLDEKHHVVTSNASFERLFGYSQRELVGKSLDDLITNQEQQVEAQGISNQALTGETLFATVQRTTKDGSQVHVDLAAVPVRVGRKLVGALGLYQDVTAQREAENALRESEKRYREIFENASEFLYSHDLDGVLSEVNPVFIRKSGYSKSELLGMNIQQLMPLEHQRFLKRYLSKLINHSESRGLLEVINKQGKHLIINFHTKVLIDNHGKKFVQGSASDITEQKQFEYQLQEALAIQDNLARSDPLTNVLNRRGIYEHLEAESARAQRETTPLSVALIDLDNFKAINDTFGHLAGDRVLQQAAHELVKQTRNYDRIGRYGGDEFLIVFPGSTPEQAKKVCARITAGVLAIPGKPHGIEASVSCGIAGFKVQDKVWPSIEDVLGRADVALYAAKRRKGGVELAE